MPLKGSLVLITDMPNTIVLTENDGSIYDDVTGVLYDFPDRGKYKELIKSGCHFIYYKGKKNNNDPLYFGKGTIGKVNIKPGYESASGMERRYHAEILNHEPFTNPVPLKDSDGNYYDTMSVDINGKHKGGNYYRRAVREIRSSDFQSICNVGLGATRNTKYWALQGNPNLYRIKDAANDLEYDWWRVNQSDVQDGDGIVFWQSQDQNKNRGVVALGVAIGSPKHIGDIDNPYWIGNPKDLKEECRRILIRYIRIPKPLWASNPEVSDILKELNVYRGQGTIFHVTRGQWDSLMAITSTNSSTTHTGIADEFQLRESSVSKPKVPDVLHPLTPGKDGSVLTLSKIGKDTITTSRSSTNRRYSKNSKYVGDCAEKQVLEYLKTPSGRDEFDVHSGLRWIAQENETPGYDIEFINSSGETVGVEVKGSISNSFSTFELTANEWAAANRMKDQYVLVVVSDVGNKPTFEHFRNPAADDKFSAQASSYTLKRVK